MQNYSRHYNLPNLDHLGDRAILEAVEINYGNVLKSGDTTTLKYNLLDGDGEILDLSNMTAVAVLKKDNKEWYRTDAEIETNASNGYIAKFKINEVLPPSGKHPYILEFIVSNEEERYIFPSDNDIELHIVSSSFSLDEEAVLDAGKKAVDGAVERFILDNSQMFKGEKGDPGAVTFDELTPEQIEMLRGAKGEPGEDGTSFTFNDLTPEQIVLLTGPKGEPGKDGTMTFEDLTPEQIESLKGEQGEPGQDGKSFTFEDLTPEQIELLTGPRGFRGPPGEDGKDGTVAFEDLTPEQINMLKGAKGEPGKDGKSFTFEDLTPEQINLLKGPKGDPGERGLPGKDGTSFTFDDLTPEQIEFLKGPKGDPGEKGDPGRDGVMTFEDLTPEQIESLRGEKGEPGEDGTSFTFNDLTPEQILLLKGERGEPGPKGDPGEKGESFTFEDLTQEQINLLKGPKGDPGQDGKDGEKGDPGDIADLTKDGIVDTLGFEPAKHNTYEIEPEDLRESESETDGDLLQKAVDFIEANSRNEYSIKLSRIYYIDKTITTDFNISYRARAHLMFNGKGGGLSPTHNGYMFSGVTTGGGFHFNKVKFLGNEYGHALIDANNLIQMTFTDCQFAATHTIVEANGADRYLQSYRFIGCNFKQMMAYQIQGQMAYDLVIDNCLVEWGRGGLINLNQTNTHQYATMGVAITKNVIEGISEEAPIKINHSGRMLIDGNYFEGNLLPDVDLRGGLIPHRGLTVTNNSFSDASMSAEKAANVRLGSLYSDTTYNLSSNGGTHTIFDFNNQSAKANMANSMFLYSGDPSYINASNMILLDGSDNYVRVNGQKYTIKTTTETPTTFNDGEIIFVVEE